MIKKIKKYMFWEAMGGLLTLLYLTLMFIIFLTKLYIFLLIGFLLLLIMPICFIFRIYNAIRIVIEDDKNE